MFLIGNEASVNLSSAYLFANHFHANSPDWNYIHDGICHCQRRRPVQRPSKGNNFWRVAWGIKITLCVVHNLVATNWILAPSGCLTSQSQKWQITKLRFIRVISRSIFVSNNTSPPVYFPNRLSPLPRRLGTSSPLTSKNRKFYKTTSSLDSWISMQLDH